MTEDAAVAVAAPTRTAGRTAKDVAERALTDAGFTITGRGQRVKRAGISVDFVALDASGATWYFDVAGPARAHRGGMQQTDVVWRALGRAHAIRDWRGDIPLVLLTPSAPRRPSEGDAALRAAGPAACFDVIEMSSSVDVDRLRAYAGGGAGVVPMTGFWSDEDAARLRPG